MSEQSKETKNKMKALAIKLDKRGRKLYLDGKKTPMDLACVCFDIKKAELWKYLPKPSETEEDYRTTAGYGRSTWYRGVRIVKKLAEAQLKRATILKMTLENAEWLGKLAIELRKDPEMVQKAIEMKEDEFMAEVQQCQQDNGHEVSDSKVNLKIRVYPATQTFIMETIDDFAERNNIEKDNPGRVLELICADARANTGKSVIATLGNAISKAAFELGQTRSLDESGRSADEILKMKSEAIDTAILALGAATKDFGTRAAGVKTKTKAASASSVQ